MDLQKEARIGTSVVNRLFNLTGEIYRTDVGCVHVFLKNGEKASWPWPQIIIRQPRLDSKYPRPEKHPRLELTAQCHCPRGAVYARIRTFDPYRGRIAQIIISCKVCRKRIGMESFPYRRKQASRLYAQKLKEVQAGKPHAQKRKTNKRGKSRGSIIALRKHRYKGGK